MENFPGRGAGGDAAALGVLLDQALGGDETALGMLVTLLHTQYGQRVINVMRKMGTGARTATLEDVFQESILRLMERIRAGELRDLDPKQRENFVSYFQRRCDNRLRELTLRVKKSPIKQRKKFVIPRGLADPKARIPGEVRRSEDLALIRSALDRLPPEKANVLRRYMEGASYEEIAKETGASKDNLMKLVSRAKEELLFDLAQRSPTARLQYDIETGKTPRKPPGKREIEGAIARLPREIREAVTFVHLETGSADELAGRLGERGAEKAQARLQQAYRTLSARLKAPFPESFRTETP
jgi:RNA polymerase sigma factor (sigma-70 family)